MSKHLILSILILYLTRLRVVINVCPDSNAPVPGGFDNDNCIPKGNPCCDQECDWKPDGSVCIPPSLMRAVDPHECRGRACVRLESLCETGLEECDSKKDSCCTSYCRYKVKNSPCGSSPNDNKRCSDQNECIDAGEVIETEGAGDPMVVDPFEESDEDYIDNPEPRKVYYANMAIASHGAAYTSFIILTLSLILQLLSRSDV